MSAKPHSFHPSHTASCVFRLAALYDQRTCAVVVTPDARQPQHLPPPEARLEGLDGLQETREGHPSPLAGLGDSGRHELEPQALCLSSRELGCNVVPSAKQIKNKRTGQAHYCCRKERVARDAHEIGDNVSRTICLGIVCRQTSGVLTMSAPLRGDVIGDGILYFLVLF